MSNIWDKFIKLLTFYTKPLDDAMNNASSTRDEDGHAPYPGWSLSLLFTHPIQFVKGLFVNHWTLWLALGGVALIVALIVFGLMNASTESITGLVIVGFIVFAIIIIIIIEHGKDDYDDRRGKDSSRGDDKYFERRNK